tara:strand:- start:2668 stop:3552 length:885 start_codon:yes stop_codon:yes gene_type:complete
MAQKVRGHRANKPNDSFGTINSETLYRGKYRDEVYEGDDQETTEVEAQQEEAEEQESNESFVETKQETSSAHDYKKRYDDLKKHYDDKVRSFKEREKELEVAMSQASQSNISLPKTAEELEKFREEYPDVYGVVETIATMKAAETSSGLEQEIETLREREKETQVQSAYRELMRNHPDFDEIKTDEKFLTWLQEQPESISDGIYKNNTDARWASRVLDLYKADQGISKKKQSKSNEAAATAVKSPKAKDISSEATGDKKIWKASQIAKMKPWEFEKHEAELDTARAEGRIDYQS